MYEIKVLNNREFDEVSKSDPRYEYVDGNNLGFADRLIGKAYVRQTHIHDLNKYLINHELEELESDESTHEDSNGIRHKKFFKDLFLPLISFGAIKSQAPEREAAQTTNVPGVGNVLNTELGMFQQPQFQQPQFQVPQFQAPFAFQTPQSSERATSPLNAPGISGSYSSALPSSVTGGITSSLSQGLNEGSLTPEQIANRKRDIFAQQIQNQGRLDF